MGIMARVSTILVAVAWLGAVILNGAYEVSVPSPAESAGRLPAEQLGGCCSACSPSAGNTPTEDRTDPVRPLGPSPCPGSCPACTYASMLTPPTWSPGSHCSAYRRLPTDDVLADSGYVRKDIDPPRA
jgi:hypothetical protein